MSLISMAIAPQAVVRALLRTRGFIVIVAMPFTNMAHGSCHVPTLSNKVSLALRKYWLYSVMQNLPQ